MSYRVQAVSINASRVIYALNWFNIAPGLKYISADLDLQIVQLGIMTTAFYLGLALFQMVGGLLASRIGNLLTSVLGISILGISVIFTGLSYNLTELFLSRLFAGIGSALFFSPALGLLAELVPKSSYSFYVGLFNGSFNLGGGLGILGWNFLDQFLGWRVGFFIAGGLMLALAIENLVALRGYRHDPASRGRVFRRAGDVLRHPLIWLLPLIALSGILTETLIGQFFVYYSETSLHFSENLASSLATVYLLVGFAGGIMGGYLFGVVKRRILMFLSSVVLLSVLTIGIAYISSYLFLLILVIAMGVITVNTLSMLYTLVVERASDRGMISFSLAFVNFLQNLIGAFSPSIFSLIAFYRGYETSWTVIGAIGIACAMAGLTLGRELKSELRVSQIKL